MSEYVQIFVGPPGQPEDRLVRDVESATGLTLELSRSSPRSYRGSSGDRGVLLIVEPNEYDDEPHLPSFADHPYEVEFYTAEKTIESERRFLDETFHRLRESGRYSLFATLEVHVRIDPDEHEDT